MTLDPVSKKGWKWGCVSLEGIEIVEARLARTLDRRRPGPKRMTADI